MDGEEVKIESGYVYRNDDIRVQHDLTVIAFFKRWKKAQKIKTIVVTIDSDNYNEAFDQISDMLKSFKGAKLK